jgi:hypothetical protein
MFSTLGSLAPGCLAVCGAVTAASAAGRGLLRAADHASRGEMQAFDSAHSLAREVLARARELSNATEQPGAPAGQ